MNTFPCRLALVLCLILLGGGRLKANDVWAELTAVMTGQTVDDLPWHDLTKWVNDGSLSNADVESSARSDNKPVKLFALAIMLRRGFDEQAATLGSLLIQARDPVAVRLFARHGKKASYLALEKSLQLVKKKENGLELATVLWQRRGSETARAWLLTQYSIRDASEALILGRVGLVDEVRDTLLKLRSAPTAKGDEARRILVEDKALRKFGGESERELQELKVLYAEARTVLKGFVDGHRSFKFDDEGRRLLQKGWGVLQREARYRKLFTENYKSFQKAEMLLWELMLDIQDMYVDDDRIDPLRLIEAAAQGITSALDRHCSYMGVAETRRSEERFAGEYVGIGAVVTKTPSGTILIESVFFGAPAWKAGIRSGDQITEVAGESVVSLSLDEAVRILRGTPGTSVTVQIIRQGWDKPVDYPIIREAVNTPSLFMELLPGDIAYAKLTQFISTSDRDLIRELTALKLKLEAEGKSLKGLILDLRDNGGGYLHTAVNICDQFLKEKQLIVFSEGRNKRVAPREEARATGKGKFKDLPLTIVINKGSASASEIVSGCMRDHQRATLIGERTFGKGSVQHLVPLDSLDAEARLRLTVAYYYLPSGESIHARRGKPGGVNPDEIVVGEAESSDTVKELIRLQKDDVYNTYINKNLRQDTKKLIALATSMAPNPKEYPGFDEWFKELKTPLSPKTVCKFLRFRVRALGSEELGRQLVADWHSDVQLQAAIADLAKKTGIQLAKIPEYAMLKTE